MEAIKQKIKDGEKLSLSEQIKLIKLGNVTLLKRYVRDFSLDRDAEMVLVRSKKSDSIMVYAKYHTFCDDAAVELAKRGDPKLIRSYLDLHPLCHKAQTELVKRFSKEKI